MSLDPKTILSPKGKVENIEIIEQNTDYTIAILSWEGKDTIAARWNPTEENTMEFLNQEVMRLGLYFPILS